MSGSEALGASIQVDSPPARQSLGDGGSPSSPPALAAPWGPGLERRTSHATTNRRYSGHSSASGTSRGRKEDTRSGLLGALGIGQSFFRGNAKEDLRKKEFSRTLQSLQRESTNSGQQQLGEGAAPVPAQLLERVLPWRRRRNRVASSGAGAGAGEDAPGGGGGRVSFMEGPTSFTEDGRRDSVASTLSIGSQVLEALQSVGPSLRQAPIAEALEDEGKRISWMNKLMGNAYLLPDQDGDSEGEEEEGAAAAAAARSEVFFNPLSPFRAQWDMVVVLCVFYSCATLPLRAAFGDNTVGPLFIIDMIITALFFVDIVLNFNTGYDDDGLIVMQKRRVRLRYLCTWFLPDLVSSVPYDAIALLAQQGDIAAYLRLLRLVRLVRLPRLFKYMSRWEDVLPINSFALRIIKLVFIIIVFVHTNACVQLLIGKLEKGDSNWMHAAGVDDASSFTQYTHALFRAVSHMITIGYGITNPQSTGEVWMVLVSMLLGAMLYAVMLGMISSMMLSMDRSGSAYVERLQMWKDYWRSKRVPQELRGRIVASFNQKHRGRKMIDEEALLRDVTPNLRADIYMHICDDLVRSVPVFQACRPSVMRVLVPSLVQEVYPPGEVIFNEGEIAGVMYFIRSGSVQIFHEQDTASITTLSGGSYFGEFAIIEGSVGVRSASARALTFVEAYSLSRAQFDRVAAHYPEVLDLFRFIAEARQAVNENRAINKDLLQRERKKSRRSVSFMQPPSARGTGPADGEILIKTTGGAS